MSGRRPCHTLRPSIPVFQVVAEVDVVDEAVAVSAFIPLEHYSTFDVAGQGELKHGHATEELLDRDVFTSPAVKVLERRLEQDATSGAENVESLHHRAVDFLFTVAQGPANLTGAPRSGAMAECHCCECLQYVVMSFLRVGTNVVVNGATPTTGILAVDTLAKLDVVDLGRV